MEDAREETRGIEIPPDTPTANAEVSGQTSEVVDMAPPVHIDEATRECQNSNNVRFITNLALT